MAVGEILLDNLPDLCRTVGRPGASAGEALAELYRRDGLDAGRQALGMFAAAIWDRWARRLTLVRDGVGARTLSYANQGNVRWFAARLATLRRTPALTGDLCLTALRSYLVFGFVSGDETLWAGARELRPGTSLALPNVEHRTYWEPTEAASDSDGSLVNQAARLRTLIEDAVRARLPTNGPVGVYLSGGVDNSLVTALAARHAPGPVHTYAIHFGPEYPNELAYSSLVANHCGTQHHVLDLPASLIQEKLLETMAALHDPIGDPLTVPNLLLGRAAARDVSTILNGEGGDPCFGGPKNSPMLLHELYAPEVIAQRPT